MEMGTQRSILKGWRQGALTCVNEFCRTATKVLLMITALIDTDLSAAHGTLKWMFVSATQSECVFRLPYNLSKLRKL
jgi:hypothetical protein